METSHAQNGLGSKVIKFLLVATIAVIGLVFIIPVFFGIFGPIIIALPFSTPMNYIVADYVGVLFIIAISLLTLYYTIKITWR